MRADSAEAFEPVARRIRSRAKRLLADLPAEDPDVVWARRAALLSEIDGEVTHSALPPRVKVGGVWRWPKPSPEAIPAAQIEEEVCARCPMRTAITAQP